MDPGDPGAGSGRDWALPIFLTPTTKYPIGILTGILAGVMYLTSNHFHIFPPQYLPMTWIDEAVPFVPWTVWIYVSEYVFFVAVYVLTKDMVNTNKYLYSFFALQTVSVFIFWVWPTTYPRHLFPLPTEDIGYLTHFIFSQVREADTPANCAPSLHVSSCYLSSFIFLDEQRKKFPFFFLWATLVAMSTMTTKQHYIIDVILGFGMAVTVYWVFHRFIPYRYTNAAGAKR